MNMCTKRCNFTGNLPPITSAPKLEVLLLWGNKLRGNIPNSISNASMLKKLELGDNLFFGPIPKTFDNLKHLEWFQISNNNLIRGPATDHEHLRIIDVSRNPLSDVLPTYIENFSKSLQYFYASIVRLQTIFLCK
ncbi:hypothetical protein Godav_010205 [Gossypium davidsonii]|uniref:Leucine-rich repeat-containing N-terminal plant-type domain-containing protein n=2 Tax=Gossypium TaxID=3633 RepID=A0A7J8SFP4_GOSDV|nr:hypothetical protein [Gossypium davidsonii]MBA0660480.1 hypothetical protein [Gossypium klotzschianum]